MLMKKNLVIMGVMDSQLSVYDAKEICINDFYQKVYNLFFYLQVSELEFNKDKLGLQNYGIFNNLFAKDITLSTDTIVYEENILNSDYKLTDGIIKWSKNIIHNKDCEEDESLPTDECYEKVDKAFKKFCDKIFGDGEFPILLFKIYKIGNFNYYAYAISR